MPAWNIDGSVRRRANNAPIIVSPEATLREVCQRIDATGEDCVAVVDPASGLPLGTLSVHDLLRLLSTDGIDTASPVGTLMNAGPVTLSVDAPLQQAAVIMVRRSLRHLVLVEPDGRFAGILAQSHLYSPQGGQVDALVRRISETTSIDGLPPLASEVGLVASLLLEEGMRAEAVCHFVSVLNDLIAVQVIDLIEPEFELPVIPWCWLLFGSEGRLEQTLLTDQDNGIVFVPESNSESDTEVVRSAFIPFARAVNEALARCGFPLCSGDVMASNPRWCLSLAEWQRAFERWTYEPEPDALLNASIFFDFRGLFGAEEPVRRMRETMLSGARSSPLCLRLMAGNALSVSPPLGSWWSAFRFDDSKYPKTIDLKKYGSRLFVDAARVFALLTGCAETGTVPRLLAVAEASKWPAVEVAAMIDGFYVLQRLRLQHQAQLVKSGKKNVETDLENRVAPHSLHELDRHLLRDALRVAGALQRRMRQALTLDQ